MDPFMVVLRLIHIFSSVFWAGATFFLVSFVAPSVMATGEEGQKFMQYLSFRTRMTRSLAMAAIFSFLSGALMYGNLRLDRDPFGSGRSTSLTLGALFGLIALVVGYAMQNRSSRRMKALGEEMAAADGPPDPEQLAEMQLHAKRVADGGRYTAVALTLAMVGMSIAQYAG